mmetsp:Transcript_1669/g.4460  ORF Transcript_1669/g.4460 Transcript_1669/m.4460 type:complete len:95 (+) Transcript_1669:292-576(+)
MGLGVPGSSIIVATPQRSVASAGGGGAASTTRSLTALKRPAEEAAAFDADRRRLDAKGFGPNDGGGFRNFSHLRGPDAVWRAALDRQFPRECWG